MKTWAEVVAADQTLSPFTKQAAKIICEKFCAGHARYCSFFPSELQAAMNVGTAVMEMARSELLAHGYLKKLAFGTGKPCYSLRTSGRTSSEEWVA
jgi:hypothetical protein